MDHHDGIVGVHQLFNIIIDVIDDALYISDVSAVVCISDVVMWW